MFLRPFFPPYDMLDNKVLTVAKPKPNIFQGLEQDRLPLIPFFHSRGEKKVRASSNTVDLTIHP